LIKNKILLVGHCPPPITGQTEAFKLLKGSLTEARIPYSVLDIASHLENRNVGKFSLFRFLEILLAVFKLIIFFFDNQLKTIYLSIGISLFGFFRDMLIIWLAKVRGLKIVIQLHGGGYKDFYESQNNNIKFFIRSTINSVDKIIILSLSLANEFEFLPEQSKEKITIIHNTANVKSQFSKLEKDFSSNPFRVLYISNLISSKGYLDLINSFALLEDLDIELTLCGKFIQIGEEKNLTEEELMIRINSANSKKKKIKFLGVVSGDYKENILSQSQIFVLPTYYKYEGQPIAIIEAMAFGLPIITTNYRSMKDMIIDNENGFLVDPKSPEHIAEKIRFLYKNRDICMQMSKKKLRVI